MKKIVLAFDSFKGSVGSFEIAKAAEKAIQEELPDCQILQKLYALPFMLKRCHVGCMIHS